MKINNMAIPQYSKVRVITSRFENEGVPAGTIGWVIEIHEGADGPAYEVEIVAEDGHTEALIVASASELEVLEEDSLRGTSP